MKSLMTLGSRTLAVCISLTLASQHAVAQVGRFTAVQPTATIGSFGIAPGLSQEAAGILAAYTPSSSAGWLPSLRSLSEAYRTETDPAKRAAMTEAMAALTGTAPSASAAKARRQLQSAALTDPILARTIVQLRNAAAAPIIEASAPAAKPLAATALRFGRLGGLTPDALRVSVPGLNATEEDPEATEEAEGAPEVVVIQPPHLRRDLTPASKKIATVTKTTKRLA